jgi:FkbM family methyltransferase
MLHFIDIKPRPRVVFEVGCGNLNETRSFYLWKDSTIDFFLFEPNKNFYHELMRAGGRFRNVHLFNCAILDKEDELELVDHGSCGYLKNFPGAPIVNNIGYPPPDLDIIYNVKVFPINIFDMGNIDVLYIDTEGTEYFVLKTLISQPSVINIEMEVDGNKNPHYDEIMQWMQMNRYMFGGKCGNDFIWHKTGITVLQTG